MFFQNVSIIRFVARELHLPEVKGVEIVYIFSNLVKIIFFSFEA
jgi:hypothetical protein